MTMNEITKNPVGPPLKVMDERQLIEIEALSCYLNMEQIADFLGITYPTFKKIMDRDPQVEIRHRRGKSRAIASVAKSLLTSAREGYFPAQKFYLNTQADWVQKTATDLSNSDGTLMPDIIEIVPYTKVEDVVDAMDDGYLPDYIEQ